MSKFEFKAHQLWLDFRLFILDFPPFQAIGALFSKIEAIIFAIAAITWILIAALWSAIFEKKNFVKSVESNKKRLDQWLKNRINEARDESEQLLSKNKLLKRTLNDPLAIAYRWRNMHEEYTGQRIDVSEILPLVDLNDPEKTKQNFVTLVLSKNKKVENVDIKPTA